MASFIYSVADTKKSHRIQQCAELFPLELRGMGSAILAGGVWAANIVISATFLTIMEHVGAAGAFGIYAGICAVSVQLCRIGRYLTDRSSAHFFNDSSASSLSISSTSRSAVCRWRRYKSVTSTDSGFASPRRSGPLTSWPTRSATNRPRTVPFETSKRLPLGPRETLIPEDQ
jgi:hypothetical protein